MLLNILPVSTGNRYLTLGRDVFGTKRFCQFDFLFFPSLSRVASSRLGSTPALFFKTQNIRNGDQRGRRGNLLMKLPHVGPWPLGRYDTMNHSYHTVRSVPVFYFLRSYRYFPVDASLIKWRRKKEK